jgi:hypothetical protein
MQTVSRRTVLKTPIKIGAGLVAFVPAMKSLTSGARATVSQAAPSISPPPGITAPPPPPVTPTPRQVIDNYAGGIATAVSGGQITLSADPGSRSASLYLRLSTSTQIWEGDWNPGLPIEIGDHIDAWGNPRGQDVLDVEKMWVNIVNLMGTISDIRQVQGGLQLQHQDSRMGAHTVLVDQRTLVNRQANPEITYSAAAVSLDVGQFLQVIGLKLKDGTIKATRLLF